MSFSDQLVLTQPPRRLSRDEMNLAEFPLTVLSTRSNPKTKTLEFSDSIKNKNGEAIERKWIITGADKFGLPTASDDEVLLGLLKLSVDDGMRSPKVYFTRYEILKTLRWTTEGRSYTRLQKALDRLSGVRIKATNAFYDNEIKAHSTKNFGILDAYEINDGRDNENKQSFFIWSEVIFKSFQVGFIKKLDLDFYLALQSAVSKRIYRYLDKHFWYKSRVQMNLLTFAHEKIGISRNYRFMSSLRQQLDPAIEELLKTGFLSRCEYVGKGSAAEIILYSGKEKPRAIDNSKSLQKIETESSIDNIHNVQFEQEDQLYKGVFQALLDRGLKTMQIEKLLKGRSQNILQRIAAIIEYFDDLCVAGSARVSKSPVGFLYRAVEKPEEFLLPHEQPKRMAQTGFAFKNLVNPPSKPAISSANTKKTSSHQDQLKSEYLVVRKQRLQELRAGMEKDLLFKIGEEVRAALFKLKGLISESRFEEAVEHGVEEKLAKLFVVPEFDEWAKSR